LAQGFACRYLIGTCKGNATNHKSEMAYIADQMSMFTSASTFQEKLSQDDDAASTASGASSDQASLPSSPGASSDLASLPSSPAKVSPEAALVTAESLADLPSLGSLGHFAGLCSRCCFHAKGRCQNGHDCRFCHFDHEKRQRKTKVRPVVGRGLLVAPVHQQLVNQFSNEAWAMPTTTVAWGMLTTPIAPVAPVALFAPPPGLAPPAMLPSTAMSMAPAAMLPIAPPMPGVSEAVESWPLERVVDWLSASGLGHLSRSFEEHRITGDILLELSPSDLEEIGIRALGDKKRLLRAAAQLRGPVLPTFPAAEQFLCPPPPCWEASFLEVAPLYPQGPCPPPAAPPVMLVQCPPSAPPPFSAPM